MHFNYMKVEEFLDSIDIEDAGKCSLCIINDDFDSWYLDVDTSLGWTKTTQFGPIKVETREPRASFYVNHLEFDYEEKKLFKLINEFINNPKRKITQVLEIESEEVEKAINIIKNSL